MLIHEFEKLSLRKFKIKSILPDATVLCLGKRRSGKCLAKDTSVMMYDGTTKLVQNIQKGELVMGDDSSPRKVLCLTNGIDKLYKVTNTNGDIYTVNSEHVLSLYYIHKNTFEYKPNENSFVIRWFNKKTLKVNQCSFYYNHSSNDRSTVYLNAKGFFDRLDHDRRVDIPLQQYLKLSTTLRESFHGYQADIKFNPGFCKSLETDPYLTGVRLNSKALSIPQHYLINTVHTRTSLFLGIVNAIGKYSNGNIVINVKEKTLADDIVYLARSLGHTCICKQTYFTKTWNIITTQITSNLVTSPISVECIGDGYYYGFELDRNHRFVLGNFVVTHNSWLVRDIFYHHRHIPSGIVFSGTEEASPFFGDFIPDCFIHSEYDPDLIQLVLNRQKSTIRKAKLSGKSDDGKLPSNNKFVVMDDMLHDAGKWKKDQTIKNIFFNGRHYNILFILTMQYAQAIPPELRSNIDYIFIFNESSIANRKKIYEAYASMIPSFEHFCNILDACTQNHECLVINTSSGSDIKDQVFWYKAEPHSNFKVCNQKAWDYHSSHYNNEYENEADIDQAKLDKLKQKFAKTKKLKVIVSRQGEMVGYSQDTD